MTNPMGTALTLSTTAIAQLTATLTGGGFKRAATKEAALKRFFAVAAERGISEGTAAAILGNGDPAKALDAVLNPAPEGRASPGLARLRASQDADTIRNASLADADAARAAVLGSKPSARKAALELGVEPEAKPAKAPKAPKVKAEKPAKVEGAVARTKLDPTKKIVAVVENPKKPGSRSHARFACYKAGETVQAFIDACVAAGYPASEANADLSWDRRKGFIKIEDAEANA